MMEWNWFLTSAAANKWTYSNDNMDLVIFSLPPPVYDWSLRESNIDKGSSVPKVTTEHWNTNLQCFSKENHFGSQALIED